MAAPAPPAAPPAERPAPTGAAAPPLPRARSITLEPLSIAYYCTGHGLGHATRAIEVRAASVFCILLTPQLGDGRSRLWGGAGAAEPCGGRCLGAAHR